jgi:uncharacterized membrane protein YwzB
MNKYQQRYKAKLLEKQRTEEEIQASLNNYSSELIQDMTDEIYDYLKKFKKQQYETSDVSIYLQIYLDKRYDKPKASADKIEAYKAILVSSEIEFVEKRAGKDGHHLFVTLNRPKIAGKVGNAGDLMISSAGELSLIDITDAGSYLDYNFFAKEEVKTFSVNRFDEKMYKVASALFLSLFVVAIALTMVIVSPLFLDLLSYSIFCINYFFVRVIENIKFNPNFVLFPMACLGLILISYNENKNR